MQPKQALQGKAAQSHQRLIHSHLNQKAGTNSNLQSLKQHPVRTETSVQGIVTDGATADGSEQHSKVTRPSATEVANHLFRILLVSEPLSVADLCKQLPEIPRDSVQNVLEVLQALGIIAQSASIKESTSSRSSSTTNLISMYSLTDYAKFSAPFPITNLETELTNMQEKARTVSARNEQLQVSRVADECDRGGCSVLPLLL